ncbi:hypothetical protein DPMN_087863 [Dreissena polymorpha]|uniref:Uncharacterized protein n=1 Tax=Dreissena polymorpha TaxID=45954 RepID=A0A9D4QWS5_DREPO|nr:hypothetical protein DPMN_087863 [Dreissena polymorpha]
MREGYNTFTSVLVSERKDCGHDRKARSADAVGNLSSPPTTLRRNAEDLEHYMSHVCLCVSMATLPHSFPTTTALSSDLGDLTKAF